MAKHAHSTRSPLLRQTTGSAGLLPFALPAGRIVAAGGPVTAAIRAMRDADPNDPRIVNLRQSLAERIEADLELLDALDGDPDLEPSFGYLPPGIADESEPSGDDEPSLCGLSVAWPSQCGDDRELDVAEHGFGDWNGMSEQISRYIEMGVDMNRIGRVA